MGRRIERKKIRVLRMEKQFKEFKRSLDRERCLKQAGVSEDRQQG
jgi:hypothetical protein